MAASSSYTKQLKAMATSVGLWESEWKVFPFLLEYIKTLSMEEGGLLHREKQKFRLRDYLKFFIHEYINGLRYNGGSAAGLPPPDAHPTGGAPQTGPSASTRSNAAAAATEAAQAAAQTAAIIGASSSQQAPPAASLKGVIDQIINANDLDEAAATHVEDAARLLKGVLEKALDDPTCGLRRFSGRFRSIRVESLEDGYRVLDLMVRELLPLEILLQGPEIAITMEVVHATESEASMSFAEILAWREMFTTAFESSLPTQHQRSNIIYERSAVLKQIAYFTGHGSRFTHRCLGPRTFGPSTMEAVTIKDRARTIAINVCSNLRTTCAEIDDLIRTIIQDHPGAAIDLVPWRKRAPSHGPMAAVTVGNTGQYAPLPLEHSGGPADSPSSSSRPHRGRTEPKKHPRPHPKGTNRTRDAGRFRHIDFQEAAPLRQERGAHTTNGDVRHGTSRSGGTSRHSSRNVKRTVAFQGRDL